MFLPGARLRFVSADGPVREPVTRIGGRPVWLEEPQWPFSRDTGRPFQFVGQFTWFGRKGRFLWDCV